MKDDNIKLNIVIDEANIMLWKRKVIEKAKKENQNITLKELQDKINKAKNQSEYKNIHLSYILQRQ